MGRVVMVLSSVTLLWATVLVAQDPAPDEALRARLIERADRVVSPERCGECHAAEFEVWERTPHATGFGTLHTTDRAKDVYQALGLRLIKRGTEETTPACLECHYTPAMRRDVLRATAGVTCESCHGPARDWIDVHNSYGVAESDFQQAARLETPQHRAQRIAESRVAGMRRPSDLYDVAANCFGCHTVPKETLVNVAGHTTGSDFELVDWSEQIRHNFLESYKTADGRTNVERGAERKRVMYVTGRALDVEYTLRGVAVATEDELYFGAMADRAGAAIDQLYYLNDTVEIPAVQAIIDIVDGVELKPNNRVALETAADAIRTAARSFIAGSDGTELAAVDPLWNPDVEPTGLAGAAGETPEPGARGRVTELATRPTADPVDVSGPAGDPPATAAVSPSAPSTPEPTPLPVAEPAVADSPPPTAVPQYEVFRRPPWRTPPEHDFVKVPCGKCHIQQQAWWQKDTHKGTAEPLRNGDVEAAEIARLYGIDPGDMARGDQNCMWCHGTVVADPTRKVRPGVGCQRCHGAGADYLEHHQTDTYAESIDKGLRDLKTPAVRATSCVGCHYITDPGLLAAGHDTGADFDVVERMSEIRHWGGEFGRDTEDDMTPATLSAAYAAVIAERGPPPSVEPIRSLATDVAVTGRSEVEATGRRDPPPASAAPTPGEQITARPAGAAARGGDAGGGGASGVSPRVRTRSPRARVAPLRGTLVDDPQFDPLPDGQNRSVEETLLQLKMRLERLYRVLGEEPVYDAGR